MFFSVSAVNTGPSRWQKVACLSEPLLIKERVHCLGWWLMVFYFVFGSLFLINNVRAAEKVSALASDSGSVEGGLKKEDEYGALDLVPYRTLFVIDDDLLQLPSDVAVDRKGRIYILDGTDSIVRIYSKSGKPLSTLGDQSTLNLPMGLDVSPDGGVLVADSGNHRVVFFPVAAANPVLFDLPIPVDGNPADPTDVVFGQHYDTFFVVDNDNHRVLALDMEGRVLWSSGRMGRNPGEFRFPFMLDRNKEGNIFIVEVINTRVQVLDKDGEYVRFIGDWGIEAGQFFRPKGVTVESLGKLFVSDSYLGVIQIFTTGGEFVGAVGDETGTLRKFTTPMGITASGKRLHVIEMYSNRLVVLEREGP